MDGVTRGYLHHPQAMQLQAAGVAGPFPPTALPPPSPSSYCTQPLIHKNIISDHYKYL